MPNPFPLDVEESLPMFSVSCTAKVFEVAGHSPTTILRTDQQWGVEFNWATNGDLNFILGGRWVLTVLLEKMGVGEFNLPHNTQNVSFFSAPHSYTSSMIWNPGEIPVGQYRLVSTILMYGPGGVPGPVCLSGDGPLLTFYSSPIP